MGQVQKRAKQMPDGKSKDPWEFKNPNAHDDWKKLGNPDSSYVSVNGKISKFLPLPEEPRKTLFAELSAKSKESKVPITYMKKSKDNGLDDMLKRIKSNTKLTS